MLTRRSFITPSTPVLKTAPPNGDGWIHEVKFDGWRAQLHKDGDTAHVYSRNGHDLSLKFRLLRDILLYIPARSVIIDAELVVCDDEGRPDFNALMAGHTSNLCAWCFDLLEYTGRDLRKLPLRERKARLNVLLAEADDHALRYSAEFPDPLKLLAVGEKMGLEGVVSKKADQPYVSGKNPGWIKVKCRAWREANKNRYELFQKA